jgi:DNA adenine methylase
MAEDVSASAILDIAYQRAAASLGQPLIDDLEILGRIEFVARNPENRAGARFILACALAKAHRPEVDIRKPYTEIGDPDAYSGRATYDEVYIAEFVEKYKLPLNPTTAWLTPAFRNRNIVMTPEINLVGRPASLYRAVLQLLDDVHQGRIPAGDLLAEMIRWLLIVRDENRSRMETLQSTLAATRGETVLSVDDIVNLIDQHSRLKHSSRLPVLVVAAAYQAAQNYLGERALPLESHTAADRQTGSLGDLQITLLDDHHVVTCYEMKKRRVTRLDIDHALAKVAEKGGRVDNYLFITTEPIDLEVSQYASAIYEKNRGRSGNPGLHWLPASLPIPVLSLADELSGSISEFIAGGIG